jgi:hypothetical protein
VVLRGAVGAVGDSGVRARRRLRPERDVLRHRHDDGLVRLGAPLGRLEIRPVDRPGGVDAGTGGARFFRIKAAASEAGLPQSAATRAPAIRARGRSGRYVRPRARSRSAAE